MKIRRFSQVPGRRRGAEGPVDVVFIWNPARPHEVTATLQGEGYSSRRWVFDRELLVAGLTRAAGLGSVTVLPDLFSADAFPAHRRRVEVLLSAPEETVALPLEVAKLREFLAATAAGGSSSRAA
jgi:hypothetical protein